MSEINKVYKQYGDVAGKEYLVLLYSSALTISRFKEKSDYDGLAAYRNRLNDYIKKEYGYDFFQSYSEFAKDAESNLKLLKELDKYRTVYLRKSITDLEKEPPKTVSKESTSSDRNENEESWKAAARKLDIVGENAGSNATRHGSVSLKGIKANYSYDEPDKAIPVVKSALFLQPHDADNWCALGDLYAEKKDWKSAVACYEKALLKNPKSSRALSGKKKAEDNMNQSGNSGNTSYSGGIEKPVQRKPVSEEVTYYFENQQEFVLYVGLNKDKINGNIIWGKGSQYQDACKRGYTLFEQKQFAQAIDAYKLALKVNPVGVAARFEICMAYCQLKDLKAAREALQGIEPYAYCDQIIAKYYRTLGYILVEEQDYKTAANAYQYSLFFEPDQQSAKQELLFIVNKAGFEILDGIKDRNKVEKVLKGAGIPLLTAIV